MDYIVEWVMVFLLNVFTVPDDDHDDVSNPWTSSLTLTSSYLLIRNLTNAQLKYRSVLEKLIFIAHLLSNTWKLIILILMNICMWHAFIISTYHSPSLTSTYHSPASLISTCHSHCPLISTYHAPCPILSIFHFPCHSRCTWSTSPPTTPPSRKLMMVMITPLLWSQYCLR